MGFWARDKADQEDRWAGEYTRVELPKKDPSFPCSRCSGVFQSEDSLRAHVFEGHPLERPVLLRFGEECGRKGTKIIERTEPWHWVVLAADSAEFDDRAIRPQDVGAALAAAGNGVHVVTLVGEAGPISFAVEVDIAEVEDLALVDAELERLLFGPPVDVSAIAEFIGRARRASSASTYAAAIADYAYGVLAREDSAASELDPFSYREKYENAAVGLRPYDRPVAQSIAGLVAFHFNDFKFGALCAAAPRIELLSGHLGLLETGDQPEVPGVLPPSGLDSHLSDSRTEEVIRYCLATLNLERAAPEFDRELFESLERYDRRKMSMFAAERALLDGDFDRAQDFCRTIEHREINDRWVASVRSRLEMRRDGF